MRHITNHINNNMNLSFSLEQAKEKDTLLSDIAETRLAIKKAYKIREIDAKMAKSLSTILEKMGNEEQVITKANVEPDLKKTLAQNILYASCLLSTEIPETVDKNLTELKVEISNENPLSEDSKQKAKTFINSVDFIGNLTTEKKWQSEIENAVMSLTNMYNYYNGTVHEKVQNALKNNEVA